MHAVLRDLEVDARLVTVGSDVAPDEPQPKAVVVLVWTSAIAVTFMALVVFGLVASLTQTLWLVTGARASSLALALWPLVLFALPLPGVVVFTAAWWPSLRRRESRRGAALSWLVPLALASGALLGLGLAVRVLSLAPPMT